MKKSLLILIFVFGCCVLKVSSKRPHIVFVLADDLGWNDVGFHGSKEISTPNIDTLAADGLILNNYYSCSICTPSRSALMSGLYPIHTGLQHFAIPAAGPWGLPLQVPTLPNLLKTLGYSTHLIGKWHLGFFQEVYTPLHRGFDTFYGYYTGMRDYFDHHNRERYELKRFDDRTDESVRNSSAWFEGLDFRDNFNLVKNMTGNYTTKLFTKRALDIIESHNQTEPLFLLMSHLAVHRGNPKRIYKAPEEYTSRFPHIKDESRRALAGSLSALDDSVGLVFNALQQRGMLKDTIFVFTSDNGGDIKGFSSNSASNWPLRGQKFTLWEGGLRTAAVLWSPLLRSAQQKISMQMMHITDWLPTLFSAAGGDTRNLGPIDGIDMWDIIQNSSPSPRTEILLNIDPIWNVGAIRIGDYKLVYGSTFKGKMDGWYGPSGREYNSTKVTWPEATLVSRTLKKMNRRKSSPHLSSGYSQTLVEVQCPKYEKNAKDCFPQKEPCLFNIVLDPCERNNFAAEHPKLVEKLLARLKLYEKTAVPPSVRPLATLADPALNNDSWSTWEYAD